MMAMVPSQMLLRRPASTPAAPACSSSGRQQQQQQQRQLRARPVAAIRAERAAPVQGGPVAPPRPQIDVQEEEDEREEAAPEPTPWPQPSSSSSSSSSGHLWDVQGAVVSPAFRASPWAAEKAAAAKTLRKKARVLFVGESNICRSVLALSITNQLLAEYGLEGCVECEAKGTRNYVLGQGPEPSTVAAAQQLGWALPQGENAAARKFEEDEDIVNFDLILVLDKFTAADVLREVSGFDLINPNGFYCVKVRLLGEFHPTLRADPRPGGQDIDDPLYGNVGGSEEYEAVLGAAAIIEMSCRGLLTWLKEQHEGMREAEVAAAAAGGPPPAEGSEGNFAAHVKQRVRSMKRIEWMVPPMLSPRT